MKLLIVDDSRVMCRKIERASQHTGLSVVGIASDGAKAVSMVDQVQPDVVTMDLTMPEMDGIECIEKSLEIKPNMLILVISAIADKATAIEALKKGAHGFLCKPFSDQELVDALLELIRGGSFGRR